MPDYICPNCRGGFSEGPLNDGCCPWCGQSMNGSHETPTVHSIKEIRDAPDDTDMGGPIYKRLFGWLE